MKLDYLFPSIVLSEQLPADKFALIRQEIEGKFAEIDSLLSSDSWDDNAHTTFNLCKCLITELQLTYTESVITPLVKEYLKTISVLKNKKTSLTISDSWINILTPHGYQDTHIHESNVISGTLYLEVPKNSGRIRFCPSMHETLYKDTFDLEPQNGLILLFHGLISHGVTYNKSSSNRISLTFNYRYDIL